MLGFLQQWRFKSHRVFVLWRSLKTSQRIKWEAVVKLQSQTITQKQIRIQIHMLCHKRLPLLRYLLLLLWLWMLTLTSWLERSSFLLPTTSVTQTAAVAFLFFSPLQRTRNECWYCRKGAVFNHKISYRCLRKHRKPFGLVHALSLHYREILQFSLFLKHLTLRIIYFARCTFIGYIKQVCLFFFISR